MENRHERFIRLATKRTNEVLKRIQILGNCANKSVYEYSQDEINKIFSEIDHRIKEAKIKFHFSKRREFKL
jgi:hypothetical protein